MAASRLVDDAYENNDTKTEARSLGNLAVVNTFKNLAMADKADWYSFNVTDSLTAAVNLKFTHANGDLDLKVFTTSGKQVGASLSRTDAESVSLKGLRAGTYYIQVFGKNGALNPNYAMVVNPGVAAPPATAIDLHGQSVLATNAASWGGAFNIDVQIKHSGNTASGAFNVQWYLSKDAVGSSDDVPLSLAQGGASYAHASIAAASSGAKQTISLKLPAATPSGFSGQDFYVIMKTDSAGQVAESNENNNFGQLGDGVDCERINVTQASTLFSGFDVWDASLDDNRNTVFNDGALRLNYTFATPPGRTTLSSMTLEAIGPSGAITTLGTFPKTTAATNALINLATIPGLENGEHQLRMRISVNKGATYYSSLDTINILDSSYVADGRIYADTYAYAGWAGSGQVFRGGGGTDTLQLGFAASEILSVNGAAGFNYSTANQAIYQGSAYDFMRLTGGREIYFQGFERVQFADGSIHELAVRPFDPAFGSQWNLHITDVPSAWRFTQGSTDVLLVSLDSGVLNSPTAAHYLGVNDISMARLITGPTDDEDLVLSPSYPWYGHGHMAVSVMASMANNVGVAGINWRSSVLITDVYRGGAVGDGVSLPQAIEEGLAYARATGKKVVFQGGIQGESWLTDGGSLAQLQDLISRNSDIALFAVAAGNGGPVDGYQEIDDPNWATSVSGVAKLENYFPNVMSVGALEGTNRFSVGALTNPWSVNIAAYSNRGSNLTLMAPTDSPAVNKLGNVVDFSGTSAANPNMAGIASLVWSVNTSLTPEAVRQILVDTAHDLGAPGDDNTYGNGLVNADAAVRRAVALARVNDLANLYPNKPLQLFATGTALTVANSANTAFARAPSLAGVTLAADATAAKFSRISPTARTNSVAGPTKTPKREVHDLVFRNALDDIHSETGRHVTKVGSTDHSGSRAAHAANLDRAFSQLSNEPFAGLYLRN